MKKLFALLVFMLACAASVAGMAEDTYPSQIVEDGGTVFYNANGATVSGPLGRNGAVVEMSKTIAPYEDANGRVENEFVVTLNVKTQEKLLEISSDTPDSAILLVMDVSNSMDDCVICGKEESHSDHQGETETHYYCSGTSGREYSRISNWNRACRYCGRLESQHNEVRVIISGAKCAYVSRLARTQAAAKDFLSEFANETGAQGDDKRMVGLVAYGSHAVNVLGYGNNDSTNWENVRTEAGMTAVMDAIDGLSVANSSYSSSLQGGGTSIEAGMTLARNILNTGAATGGEINGIDYVYTILLTDGQPTYPVNNINSTSVESISGTTNNQNNSGSSTQTADYNDAADLATAIRSLNNNGLSKLYSICFGKVNGSPVWNLEVIGNDTVGEWLTSFSTAAYNAEAAQDANLFDAFNSVMTQIQIASKAWKVEDWMGEHMILGAAVPVSNGRNGTVHNAIDRAPSAADYADGNVPSFVWDILGSEPDPSSDYNEELQEGTLSYTYKYRVTLNNLPSAYTAGTSADVNKLAQLKYIVLDGVSESLAVAPFAEPQVKGLESDFVFTKWFETLGGGYEIKEGIEFKLSHIARPDEWTRTAKTNANGVVTFKNIPSGHDYVLTEINVSDDYLFPGGIQVDVDFGESATNPKTPLEDFLVPNSSEAGYAEGQDGMVDLINARTEEKLAKVTITKSFTGIDDNAARVVVRIYRPADEAQHLSAVYDYHVLTPGSNTWEFNIRPGYDYYLSETTDIPGWNHTGLTVNITGTTDYEVAADGEDFDIPVNSSETVTFTKHIKFSAEEDATVALALTNAYTRKEGTLTIEKVFEGLTQDVSTSDKQITVTVTQVADANGTALTGAKTYTLPFTYANGKYTTSATLPIGFYKLEETTIPSIDGYTLLHVVFKDGTTSLGRTPVVEIKEGADAALALTVTNHYEQDRGNIHVFKVFGGSLAQGDMTAEEYKEFLETEIVDDDGNPIVITINVKQGSETVGTMYMSADTDWAAELNDLPIGEYTLEEVTTNLDVEDHILKSINWSVAGNKVTVTKGGISRVTVTNNYDEAESELAVTKTFAYGQDMTDATFANKTIYVYVMQDDGNPDTYDLKDTLALNAANQWTDSAVLPVGTYQLYEAVSTTNANTAYVPGYTLVTEWTINGQTQTGNGVEVELEDHDQAQTPKVEIGLKNTYTVNDGTLMLSKQNAGNTANMPSEIQFVIKQGDTVVKEVVLTHADDWQQSISLTPGTYTVTEVVAEGANPAMISWSGDVTGATENSATVTITIGVNSVINVICENDYYYQHDLTFKKIDIATQQPIAGVEFTLRHTANCCSFAIADMTATSAADGTVTFNKVLGPHTYVLTETALKDYAAIAPMTVVATEAGVSISGVTNGIINNVPVDWPTTTLSFTKTSSFTNAPLAGAEFTLTHNASECTGVYHGDAEHDSMTATSGSNGLVSFSNVETGHTYTLTETKTPAGYNSIDPMTVVVDNGGNITVTNAAGEIVDLNGKTLVNDLTTWPTTNLGFAKYSSYTQQPLANVQFSLSHSADCTGCMHAITEPIVAKSGVNGSVWLANIPVGHTYILSETVVPSGYNKVADMIVVVAKDKTITVKNANGETIALQGSTLYNHLTTWPTASLSFTKYSSYTSAPLAGVEFTLEHSASCKDCPGLPEGVSSYKVPVTTLEDGKVAFTEIPAGHTYTLSETKVPNGYTVIAPMTVTVATDMTVTVKDSSGAPVALEGSTLYNHLTTWPTASLSFTKYSSYTSAPLAGVEFTLEHSASCKDCPGLPEGVSSYKVPVTTLEDGKVAFTEIPAGHTYTLSETKVPDGYTVIAPMTVTVATDMTVTVKDSSGAPVALEGSTLYNHLITWPTASLSFTKYSSYTSAPLAGVEFTLEHSASCKDCPGLPEGVSSYKVPVTTLEDGKVAFTEIPAGHTYTLSETKVPDGYTALAPMTVTVATDMTVTVKDSSGAPVALEGSTLYNHLITWPTASLSFTKYSSYTSAPLAGVEFTLEHSASCKDCPGLPEGVSSYKVPVTTLEDGKVAFTEIPAGHTYTLTETKVPSGYTVIAPMTVTVATDMTVTVKDSSGAPVALEGSNLYNDLIEWPTKNLTFTKLSSYDNSVIEGAQFDLVHGEDCCETEIDLAPATSDKYGMVTIEEIPLNHTYILREIVTPVGYKTMADMKIRANDDGIFIVDEENDDLLTTTGLIIYNDLSIIPSTLTLGATKTMDGKTPKDQYTFILSYNGEEIARTQNDGSEITFAPLLFTEEGKETFTITEEVGDDAKVLYDKSVYTITVTAKKGADDVLELDVDIDKDGNTHSGAIEFHNETMKELPETGDNSKLGLWLAMLAMTAVGFAVLAKRKAVRG